MYIIHTKGYQKPLTKSKLNEKITIQISSLVILTKICSSCLTLLRYSVYITLQSLSQQLEMFCIFLIISTENICHATT